PSVSGVATAKFREGFREGDCASQISRRVGADVVSAIADRVKFRRKARWTQILYRKANGGAQEGFPRHRDQQRKPQRRLQLLKVRPHAQRWCGGGAPDRTQPRI